MRTKKIATMALFTVIALTIHVVENAIPLPVPLPGIKLGLANVVTLFLLCCFSPGDAFAVLLARILLSALFAGQALSLLYSLVGGLCCFAVIWLLNRVLNGHFLPIISIFGALFHNLGQLAVAFFLTRTAGVLSYLPFLILSGTITGLFTGLCAHYARRFLMPYLQKQM